MKGYLFGPVAGLFQLFQLWMLYMAWSTMHFCQSLFMVFFLALEGATMIGYLVGGAESWLLWVMSAYNVIGAFWCYTAYKKFFSKYSSMMGGQGGSSQQPFMRYQPSNSYS